MSKKGWKILTVVFAGAGVLMLVGAYLPISPFETYTVWGDKADTYVQDYYHVSPDTNPYLVASQKGDDVPGTCVSFMFFYIPPMPENYKIRTVKLHVHCAGIYFLPIKIGFYYDEDKVYPHKPVKPEDATAVTSGKYEECIQKYISTEQEGWMEILLPVEWVKAGEWLKFAIYEYYPNNAIFFFSSNTDKQPYLEIYCDVMYHLTVKTNPPYCDVTVAGQTKNSGTSGAKFYLNHGNYKVTVSKEGYVTKTVTVSLWEDKTITVTLEPEVNEYTLTVHTTPTYCTVEVMDGDTWTANSGASGKCTFTLEEDQYYVTVSKDGYKAQTKIVTLDSNKDVYFTLEPETQEYTLTVYVDPVGATVEVGGQTEIVPPSGVVEFTLEEGTYTVTVYKDGYNTVTRQINLNQNMELHISLTPQRPDIAITHYMNVIGLTMLLLAIPCGVKGWYL